MTAEAELERLVRYCHPEKLLRLTTPLPGAGALDEATLARLYGVPAARYRTHVRRLREEARTAAAAIAHALGDGIATLRAVAGDRVIALGDSQTDDLGSWAEILRHVLGTDVVNAGVSGDTTGTARARIDRLPAATLAIVLLGTNDARRHGRAAAPMLVSHPETARNLLAIDAALRQRSTRVRWITPPPVDESRLLADPVVTAADLMWRAEDISRKADLVRSAWNDAIDLWPLARPPHLAPDGLHLSAEGQRHVAGQVVRALLA